MLALNRVIGAGEEHSLSWKTDVLAEFPYWWQHFLRGEGGGEFPSLPHFDGCVLESRNTGGVRSDGVMLKALTNEL